MQFWPVKIKLNESILLILGCAVIGLISYIDLMTAQRVSLYVFYAVPIFFGAWYAGRAAGIFFCAAAVWAWMIVDLRINQWELSTILWNAGLRFAFFVAISVVVSSLKSILDREKASAGLDYLTELPNRRTFLNMANQEREKAMRHKRSLTLAYIDLDDFKEINDRSGHDIGDLLLKEVASILKNSIRTSDLVARIGGDEFVVLFPETDYNAGRTVLTNLENVWKKRMQEKQLNVSMSIGAVTYSSHFPEVMQMVQNADRVMYAAKASGKNRILHELADEQSIKSAT